MCSILSVPYLRRYGQGAAAYTTLAERKYNTMDHAEENHYNILQDFVQLEVDINPKNVKVSMQGTGALSSLIITFIVKVQFNACHFKEITYDDGRGDFLDATDSAYLRDPSNFNINHFPSMPEIDTINDIPLEKESPIIKKVQIGRNSLIPLNPIVKKGIYMEQM